MTKRESILAAVAILLLSFWFLIHSWKGWLMWDTQIQIDKLTLLRLQSQQITNLEYQERLLELERVTNDYRKVMTRMLIEKNQVEEVVQNAP